jgi:hypothetical protein
VEKDGIMNALLKVLILGFLFLACQPLFSDDIERGCDLQKANDKYKKQLNNSVWIVPPSTLLAFEYLNGNHIAVSDQTVWVINEYNQGYFFGDSYTSLNNSLLSQRKIVGSITPCGNVYITFYSLSGNEQNIDVVNGFGTFKKHKGKYSFLMQMNSAQNSLTGLSHWSYMISVKPEDYFYQHLPGVGMSVPQFISQF